MDIIIYGLLLLGAITFDIAAAFFLQKKKSVKQLGLAALFALAANFLLDYLVLAKVKGHALAWYDRFATMPWSYAKELPAFYKDHKFLPILIAAGLAVLTTAGGHLVSIRLEKRTRVRRHRGKWIALFVFGNLALFLKFSLMWAIDTLDNVSIEEILFNLATPLEEASQNAVVIDFVTDYLLFMIPFTVVYVIAFVVNRRLKDQELMVMVQVRKRSRQFAWEHMMRVAAAVLTVIITVGECCAAYYIFGVDEYRYASTHKSTIYESYYVKPDAESVQFPEKKKNLLLIYCESMEITYASGDVGGGFSDDHIAELTELALANECFGADGKLQGAHVTKNASWTMAGMVAQNAGVPLTIPFRGNGYGKFATFLPGLVTLGDLLQEQGYSQYCLIGSSAKFAGYDTFLTSHGNFTIYDYNYAIAHDWIPEDYYVNWGFEDKKVFAHVKEELTEAAKKEPFTFAMQTMDTHFPDGCSCSECQDRYPWSMENAIACSSRQISEFVKWVQEQDFYEDTVIVIAGDHLNMSGKIPEMMTAGYDRRTYFTIINSEVKPVREEAREYTTLDIFPTILAAIGCRIPGDRLGLGTNLYAETDTLMEELGIEYLNEELGKGSNVYDEFLYGENRK